MFIKRQIKFQNEGRPYSKTFYFIQYLRPMGIEKDIRQKRIFVKPIKGWWM